MTADQPLPARQALFNRGLLLLLTGQTISMAGNQIYGVARVLWLKRATESASLIALMGIIAASLSVLLSPLGGAVADRYPRRRLLVLSDTLNGTAVLLIAVLMFAAPDSTALIVTALIAMTALAAANGSYFGPSMAASVPDLVAPRQVPAATSAMQSSFQISTLLGQAAGGALFQWLGAPVLFLVNAISFGVAAASESFLRMPPPAQDPEGRSTFRRETSAGIRYVWSTRGLRATVIGSSLLGFFAVPVQILFPFFVDDFLKAGPSWYGYILAAQGIGSLAGLVLAGSLPLSGGGRGRWVLACMLAQPLALGVLAMVRRPGAALALALFAGVVSGFVGVAINSILQCNTPREFRGRVFGAVRSISAAASPLAMGLAGIAADALDKNIPLIYQFCSASMLATACLLAFNREFRRYVSQEFHGNAAIGDARV